MPVASKQGVFVGSFLPQLYKMATCLSVCPQVMSAEPLKDIEGKANANTAERINRISQPRQPICRFPYQASIDDDVRQYKSFAGLSPRQTLQYHHCHGVPPGQCIVLLEHRIGRKLTRRTTLRLVSHNTRWKVVSRYSA